MARTFPKIEVDAHKVRVALAAAGTPLHRAEKSLGLHQAQLHKWLQKNVLPEHLLEPLARLAGVRPAFLLAQDDDR
jgi:hypothetical protein